MWAAKRIQFIFFFVLVVQQTAFAKHDDSKARIATESAEVIGELYKSKKCRKLSDEVLHCHVEYKGTKVEFAGTTIYVNALGAGQTVSPAGNKCVELNIAYLRIILRSGATIMQWTEGLIESMCQ